jgi:hypothetical protein
VKLKQLNRSKNKKDKKIKTKTINMAMVSLITNSSDAVQAIYSTAAQ